VAITLPKLEGRITIPTGGYIITVTEDAGARTSNVTIDAGDYYWTSGVSGGNSLVAQLKAELDGDATLLGTYTVSIDDADPGGTGKLTISVAGSASTFGISDWDQTGSDTTLMDLCGFTGVVPDGASATGAEHVEYLWMPNVVRSSPQSPDGDLGYEFADFSISYAPSGETTRIAHNRNFRDNLEFRKVHASKVWITHEVNTNESLQKFWRDVIYLGKAVRYHKDRATDATYVDWVVVDGGMLQPEPEEDGWTGAESLWNWRSDVVEAK